MANIDTYIQQIQNAVYGEEVRSSIINALKKVNDDNESYQDLKDEIVAAKDEVDEQVQTFETALAEAETAKTNLETAITNAASAQSELKTATSTANTAKSNLTTATTTANTARTNLNTAITNAETAITNAETAQSNLESATSKATTAQNNLEQAITDAETAQSNLETATSTANTSRTNLNTTITNATTAKSELQTVIDNAGTTQTSLSSVIADAETAITNLTALNNTSSELLSDLKEQNEAATANISELESATFDANEILTGVEDIKAYLGYTDEDIVGLQVDYANKTFQRLAGAYDLTAGEDFDAYEMFGGRKRCNVSDDGTIVAWYGDEDYAEDGSMGQVMVYQPKFYYKVVPLDYEKQSTDDGEGAIGYHLRKANYYVSTKSKTGFKVHPAFIDANGNEVDYILLSAFEGSLYDASEETYVTDDSATMDTSADMFCSISGVKPASGLSNNLTRPNIETLAQNRGANWHGDLIKAESANQLLMMIELGTMNTQTAIENGVVSITDNSSYNCSSLTGSTSELGNTTGAASVTINEINGTETEYSTAGKRSVSYRGVENPWGNIWKHVYGVNIHGDGTQKGGIPFICSDFSFAESKMTDNYESAGFTVTNANGYISAMGYGGEDFDWLFMASECSGNSSLPVGDYHYVTSNLNGYRIARLGGSWSNGSYAGGFYWYLNNGVGNRDRTIGGRLVYVPNTTDESYSTSVEAWETLNRGTCQNTESCLMGT